MFRRGTSNPVSLWNILLVLLGIGLIVLGTIWVVRLSNAISMMESSQNDGGKGNKHCTSINETLVDEFCLTNSSSTEFFTFVNDLEDKIANGFILKSNSCILPGNIIVGILLNNASSIFPAPNSSTNDAFINGLPNICAPGTNIGHFGNSPEFIASALLLINTVPFNATTIHYENDSIHSIIGKSFLNKTLHKCLPMMVEVYCYGYNPIYVYKYK